MLKANVGFLSVGAAGSNIAEVADIAGYRAAVMNTAEEDLNAITTITNKFKIGNQGGCGKDRNIAKREVKSHYKDIIEFVRNTFDNNIELIYVCFSTGGGTGSGMGPMITDLLNKMIPEKKFAILGVLPSLEESVVAQFNTLECLNEISKLNLPTLLVDNNKFLGKQKLTKKQLFDTINESVIEDFDLIFKERKSSKYGNIDKKDLMKMLTTPGNMSIVPIYMNKEEVNDVTKVMINNLNRNIYADLELDNVVKRIAFLFEIPDSATKSIDYESIQREIGKPIELFEGIYTEETISNFNSVSIFAGLSFPQKRINAIKEVIDSNKQQIGQQKKLDIFDNSELDWFSDLRDDSSSNKSLASADDLDLDALFSNY